MVQVAENRVNNKCVEKRSHARCDIDHYPVLVKKPDNTRIHAYLSNLSYSGLQVKCNRLSAHILAPKSGLIDGEHSIEVQVSLIIPFKNGLEKILVNCDVKYMAVTKDKNKDYAYALGLQITNYMGKSFQTIQRIINGEKLPVIKKSNVVPIKKSREY